MKLIRKEDGAGGKYMMDFLRKHVISRFDSKAGEIALSELDDSSDFNGYAFTTDSYVVSPPVFPGGSIGSLAVCGTANDLAVMGAKPAVMSMSLIVQDGFSVETLDRILDDMAEWLEKIDAKIITGDTKVVEANIGIAVNTTGIGLRNEHLEKNLSIVREYRSYPYSWVRDRGLAEGDAVIITGNIAEHAAAIMASREGFGFELDVESDVYPVWLFLKNALETGGITAMKDPTRGGIAAALNEIAEKSGVGILIEEEKIPIRDDVKSFCDVLGLDPLMMANEGKVVMGVVADLAEEVLKALKKAGQKDAAIVGYATSEFREVVIETTIGTRKIMPPPTADPIPRVC
ncbi:hydrogenase expression/formation protein HypE [Archaeoglobus veneficus]|uniref:Hydrogenase expression/formation protein HypE n=1 Tax=Archaeoglobus veneficus (strain DSM 11195 / SNP6) TaxID=693661 RepID=F2KN82_ARCVS|nr:hydrogenase expression/formation protein HypE [Archaeoglobus veneficus]AEA46183.1 hydrogenase expression/formation protein HypE [Archaeoglobus veneficus SNP6]